MAGCAALFAAGNTAFAQTIHLSTAILPNSDSACMASSGPCIRFSWTTSGVFPSGDQTLNFNHDIDGDGSFSALAVLRSTPYIYPESTTTANLLLVENAEYRFRPANLDGATIELDGSDLGRGATITICTGVCESAPTGSVTAAAISAAPGDTVRLSAVGRLPAGSSANAPTYAWTCMRPTVPAAATLARPAAVTLTGDDMATATFTAPALMDDAMPPNVAAAITVVCQVAISGPGGNAAGSPFMVTVTITERGAGAGAAAATNEAVLPNVLRQQTHGIHNGILQRIQQRQTQDGKWK